MTAGRPRVSAYVMLADPSYLVESLSAYYDRIDRLVVSYDETARSWSGTPLPLEQCLEILRGIDRDHKRVEVSGDYSLPELTAQENDNRQRQRAIDAASADADWVVQLDTDEVLTDPDAFFGALERADAAGAGGLDYPSRWLYCRFRPGRYLEATARLWRRSAGYPGPLAVRSGTTVRFARQAEVDLYRVDWAAVNTDPWHPRDAPVHEVVRLDQAVLHFSWVRDPDVIRRKFDWSGHREELTDPRLYREWAGSIRHPYAATLASVLPWRRWLRPSDISEPPGGSPVPVRFPREEGRSER